MRIIASMTTLPSRIDFIRPAIESVISQIVPIEHIELNIPYLCVRTNEPYVLPDWLEGMDRVRVFRTEDYGPITKVAPTLLRYQHDRCTYVWSVDDDYAYPPNQLELLCRCHQCGERRVLTRHGGSFQPDGSITFMFGELRVSMFEGFGTVLYPPACIGEDFSSYIKLTSEDSDCRLSDDLVLSHYFSSVGLPIYLCNKPNDKEPFYPTGSLPFAGDKDALNTQGGGHLARYKRVFEILKSVKLNRQMI
jgi:hypothetical protein